MLIISSAFQQEFQEAQCASKIYIDETHTSQCHRVFAEQRKYSQTQNSAFILFEITIG